MPKYYNTNILILIIVLSLSFFLVACEPKLDGTNRNTMDESIKTISSKLPETKLRNFEKCVFCILKNEEYLKALQILDGLTVDEVITLGSLKQEAVDKKSELESKKTNLENINANITFYQESRVAYEHIIKAILEKKIDFSDIYYKSDKFKNVCNQSSEDLYNHICVDTSFYINMLKNNKLVNALIRRTELSKDISRIEEWERKTISIYDSLNLIKILKYKVQPIDRFNAKIYFLIENSHKKPVYALSFSLTTHSKVFPLFFDLKNAPIMPGESKEIFAKSELYDAKPSDKISAKCIYIDFSSDKTSDFSKNKISKSDVFRPLEMEIYIGSTYALKDISYEDIARKKIISEKISKLIVEQQRIIDNYYPEFIEYLKKILERCISKFGELEQLRTTCIKEIGEIESVYNKIESKYSDLINTPK